MGAGNKPKEKAGTQRGRTGFFFCLRALAHKVNLIFGFDKEDKFQSPGPVKV